MSTRLGGIKGCKYKTSFTTFERVKISLVVMSYFRDGDEALLAVALTGFT